mgnify:CR=1 FL=1
MALTNLKIKSAAVGERHHDGRGLYLTLSAPGFCFYSGKFSAISSK